MKDKLLRMDRVSHRFGSLEVLSDIRLEIEQDEFVAIVGPSGCGKTTLLNIICDFYHPTSGTVLRTGTVRMVYQNDGLFPWLTTAENIALSLRHIPDEADRLDQLNELLRLARLEDFSDYFPHQLSGGMRRRVELARVLASSTNLILMDEPFSSLDYQTRLKMRREFVRVLDQRPATVVLVTHDLEEAALLADRILVLSDRPARLVCEMRVDLKRPRDVAHPAVVRAVAEMLNRLQLQDGCVISEHAQSARAY